MKCYTDQRRMRRACLPVLSISRCHLLVSVALGGIKGNQPSPITDEGVALVSLIDKPCGDGTRLFPSIALSMESSQAI